MAKKSPGIFRNFHGFNVQPNDAVASVTETAIKEILVAAEKGGAGQLGVTGLPLARN